MYNLLCNIDRLEKIYLDVRKKTKHKKKLLKFELYYISNIIYLYNLIVNKKYSHKPYHIFLIKKPKYRIVMSEEITDKIINHLISEVILLPIIEPKLLDVNVATRRKKGTSKGIYYVKKYLNEMKRKHSNFYILKCDIKKYFYNIDHEVLLNKLKKDINDRDIINVIDNIIKTTNSKITTDCIKKIIDKEIKVLKKININSKDRLKKIKELESIPLYNVNGRGLPIGNMTSQIFAIYYLNDLDHYIKEKLKIKYYIRYMDDFIIFHEDKKYLEYCYQKINEFVKKEKLVLNDKTKIFPIKDGLNFLGYRFIIKNNKVITLINPKTKRRIIKKLKSIDRCTNKQNVIASYHGYFINSSVKSINMYCEVENE